MKRTLHAKQSPPQLVVNGVSFRKKTPDEKPALEKRVSQDSQVSLVSDKSNGTPVYRQVKELLKNLTLPDENELPVHDPLKLLLNQTADIRCRDIVDHKTPKEIQGALDRRFRQNYGDRPRTSLFPVIPDEIQDLLPYVPIHDMLFILKAQEKMILIEEWRDLWHRVRRPQSRWYEKRDKSFNVEVKKCREFLVDPSKQLEEFQTRLALLDLQRNLAMEQEMH